MPIKRWRGPGRMYERHYAVSVDGLRVTFDCPRGHRYVTDFAKKPKHRRPGEAGLRFLARYWDREHGGAIADTPCPECARSA